MGFGHRIYKNNDPRARLIAKAAHDVFAVCGREPLIDIAVALEAQALKDEYFISRKLYPNVDFYSGIIYRAIGLPTDMFPVLFAIPRIAGWLRYVLALFLITSHWKEAMADPNGKIWRPRQVYVGHHDRKYVPMAQRGGGSSKINIERFVSCEVLINSRTGVAKRTGAASFKGKSKL
jgi:citrate synthase